MAWRMAVKFPALWAGIVTIAAEVHQGDRGSLKAFAGKPAYVFRGERDPYYSASALKSDTREHRVRQDQAHRRGEAGLEERLPDRQRRNDRRSGWTTSGRPARTARRALAVEKAIAEKDVAPRASPRSRT